MNEPALSREPDASPRLIGGYRLAERVEVREVGTLHVARRDGAAAELLWWTDMAALPEIGATWVDVVRAYEGIRSPHVLVPHATGEQGSLRWMAFSPFYGETLASIVRRTQSTRVGVPWQIACRIVSDAAAGLEALHACRDGARRPWPLHGSLSGASISVGFDGKTVLFDPGRLFPVQAPSQEALAYSAPERVWSEPSDARADVFALGVLLWELAAGRRLFRGRDDDETRALLEAHVVADLSTRVRGVPPSVDALLRRALARAPEDRFETAAELAMEAAALADTAEVGIAEVAMYMREQFADRERAQHARFDAASEATEVNMDSAATPAIAIEEAVASDSGRASYKSSLTLTREDATLPRGVALSPPPPPPRPRMESHTALDAEESVTRRHRESAPDPAELKTLPRISNTQIPSAVPVDSEDVASAPESTTLGPRRDAGASSEPTTRRKSDPPHPDAEHTHETPLQETRVRPPKPAHEAFREEGTPTRIRPDAGAQRTAALQRPATPLEAPARPRRPSTAAMRAARQASEPVAVARPGPVPAPPRPPARTIPPANPPPPAAPPPVAMQQAPLPAATSIGMPAITSPSVPLAMPPRPMSPSSPGVVPLGGPPTINAPLAAPLPIGPAILPIGPQPYPPPQMAGAMPMQPMPMQPMPMGMPMGMPQPGMPMGMQGQAAMAAMPISLQPLQPLPPMPGNGMMPVGIPGTTSDSVAFGPIVPVPSTVLEEPAEKVIVDHPGHGGFPQPAPPPEPAPMPVAASPAPPPARSEAPPGGGGALLLPRDPNMSAMQRALLAREKVREPERKLALPVVIAALVLAVGVAIGIPLLSKRPTRVVSAPVGSASVAASPSVPSAAALPSAPATGFVGPVGPTPSVPGMLGTAPTGPVPGMPPPLPPVASAPLNPFALPDSNRTARREGTAAAKPPRRRDPAPARPPRTEKTERERPSTDDDDDDAPLPKEFEQREKPAASREPKEPTSSSGKGLLTVVCSPPCDEVLDGSKSLGASPVVKVPVSAGTHRLTLRISEPPMEKVVTVTVSPDETTFLTQPMTK